MTTFSKDEIFTASEVVRNFKSVLDKVCDTKGETKRAVIVRNNKFEAVLLNMGEYERLCEAVEILKNFYTSQKRENNG